MTEVETKAERMRLGEPFVGMCCTSRRRLPSGRVRSREVPCAVRQMPDGKWRLEDQTDGLPVFFRRLDGAPLTEFDVILLDPATPQRSERLVLVDGANECYVDYNIVLKCYDVTQAHWED